MDRRLVLFQGQKRWVWVGLLFLVFFMSACARYVTPGAGVMLSRLADADIQELLNRKPAASFPVRLAVVRVQAPNYQSHGNHGYGSGRYSVVTTRDIEEEKHFERIKGLQMIAGVAPISRLLLSPNLESDKQLRLAAASLQADMLLVYTLDTIFRVRGYDIGPLSVIFLGFLPNQEATVTTTASAVIYDVRTGFVYGLAESTAKESQMASIWTTQSAIDRSRLVAEKMAFEQLLDEFEKTWTGVLREHAPVGAVKTSHGT